MGKENITTKPPDKQTTALSDDTVQEIVEKKRRKRPDRTEAMTMDTKPGENRHYMEHSLKMWDWQKPDMTKTEQISQRVKDYFMLCAEDDIKPSVEGLAVAFGVSRKTIWSWANGVDCKFMTEDSRNIIKKAYSVLNAQVVDYLQGNHVNTIAAIFLMKNNMGYSDKTEVVVTPNQPIGEEIGEDYIAEKYQELPESTE